MEHQMEYKFSSVVDPSTYETHGLCDGIPLRCHHQPELEEIEAFRCQEDWRRWVGPLGFYKGGLGPRWNFIAITVPECRPDRLAILGYANELAFLHDGEQEMLVIPLGTVTDTGIIIDITDIVPIGDAHNDDLKATFEQLARTGDVQAATSGKRAIQARIAREMLALHKEQATVTMRSWAKFAELGSGRHHDTHFRTEAEYIQNRMFDIGTMYWYGVVTFGMAISIPDEEVEIAHELANVAYLNLGLTNDLYSYQKEHETAMSLGQDFVVNLIWVLMEEHGITEAEAKDLCRAKIKQTILDFRHIVRETNARADLSGETKRYLEGLLYSLSGNLVWSIDCPRYHTWSSYNTQQLDWMKNGIPGEDGKPSGCGYASGQHSSSKHAERTDNLASGVPSPPASDEAPPDVSEDCRSSMKPDHSGLVNIFAAKGIKDLAALNIRGDPSIRLTNGHGQPNGFHPDDQKTDVEPGLDTQIIQAPCDYLHSLPSKNVREKAIEAINIWLQVPPEKLASIKLITQLLHNASLMLDDLEDGSPLRRGHPATHSIFGAGQTVNAANYQILRALQEVQALGGAEDVAIYAGELERLYVGQSLDLHWTSNLICPSIEQYLEMIEYKTGGLFRLFGRLMIAHSTTSIDLDVAALWNSLGRYYQARDDYQNLVSPVYEEQKGYCEDLDEGKYSLPLIHLLQTTAHEPLVRNLLTQRRVHGASNASHKQTLLALMEESGSLAFTADFLAELRGKVEAELAKLEGWTGLRNDPLRGLLRMLVV
ncbi:geranylgeranyl pyrophosphate synthase [Apiospora saccharicola]|uniref:Geranylgeranyl pyrophosphate synthase n=1 Tax=Apiospora saccharicola TaxID=335842 RepID=A0ABR1TP97_9PEZI